MICERCKRAEATIHLTEIIQNVKSEVHLCENCAREIGLNSKLSGFSLSLPEILSFLEVNEVDDEPTGIVCLSCGLSYADYLREGKLGCPDCYRYMDESIKKAVAAYHGSLRHIGKHPLNVAKVPDGKRAKASVHAAGSGTASVAVSDRGDTTVTIEKLKEMLEAAILEERFEDAAVLRDRIRQWNTL